DDEGTLATASDTATLVVTNLTPSITVEKSGPDTIVEGNTITYTYKITNTSPASTDPVTIDSIVDSILGDLTPTADVARGGRSVTLAPGESFTFTVTTGIQNVGTGTVTNTVSVQGHDDENTPTNLAQDTHTVTIQNAIPTIVVDKTGPPTIAE